MSIPKRIQRSRKHKLPANTKCVSRPSKFANPFFVEDGFVCAKSNLSTKGKKKLYQPIMVAPEGKEAQHQLLTDMYRQLLDGERWFGTSKGIHIGAFGQNYPFYIHVPTLEEIKEELSGYDFLACWCGLDLPCHVDVLVEKLNHCKLKEKKRYVKTLPINSKEFLDIMAEIKDLSAKL